MTFPALLFPALLAVAVLPAAAAEAGLLANLAERPMEVSPDRLPSPFTVFTLALLDRQGAAVPDTSLTVNSLLLELLGVNQGLPDQHSLQFVSEHATPTAVSYRFRVQVPAHRGAPAAQFHLLFVSDKTDGAARAGLSVDESEAAIARLPFHVVTTQGEPHKVTLMPKDPGPAQAPGVAQPAAGEPKGCCVIL